MRRYLGLILTIASLPLLAEAAHATCPVYNLANNTTADATQVMANFNCILSGPSFSGPITFQGISAPAVSASGQGTIYFDAASHSFKVSENGGTYAALVNTGGGGSSQWTTSGSNVYFSSGNVGIGTTNPTALLSVGSSNPIQLDGSGHINIGGSGYMIVGNTAVNYHSNSLTSIYYELGHGSADQVDTFLSSPAAGYVYAGTAKSGAAQYNATIIAGGMGIGTTSPSQALHVVGNIYATGNITCGGTCGGGGDSSQWTTSGSNVYFSSGNVGIGTSSPGARLTVVAGTNGAYDGITLYPNNQTQNVQFGYSGISSSNAFNISSGGNNGDGFSVDTDHLVVRKSNGNVGIGTSSPSYTLHVNGTAYATGAAGALSDARDKKNVQPLALNALEVITKLRPVTFYWKAPRDNGMTGRQTGLIAQEVEKVLPSTVLTAKDARKSKAIKYDELTAVLIKAVQEQQRQIQAQVGEIRALRSANAEMSKRLTRLEQPRFAKSN